MKAILITVITLIGLTGTAVAEPPVALVEELQGKVTGAEFMDYVTPGQVIKIGPGGSIVLSYLKSCRRETISGIGTVIVGSDASKVHFISVSVDPDHDTPAALNAFAEIFHALPGWRFLTGKKADIDRILKACGVYTLEPNYHTARVFIGSDAAGWSRLYGLSPHSTLAQAVRRVMLCGVNGKETMRE